MSELAVRELENSTIQTTGSDGKAALLHAVATGNVSPENAKVAMELYKEMRAMDAKESFAIAFSKLQASFPRTLALRVIKGNDGAVRSTFASFDDIMQSIAPHLAEHGFAVSFDAEVDDKRIQAVCNLTHVSGHSQTSRFAVRLSAPPGTSPAQADGSTMSYAKRYALCNILNISITHDTDARLEGDFITAEQAESLKARVAATKSDVAKFLKLAAAMEFTAIRTGKYAMLDAILLKKEKQQSAADTGHAAGTGAAVPIRTAANVPSNDAAPAQSNGPTTAAADSVPVETTPVAPPPVSAPPVADLYQHWSEFTPAEAMTTFDAMPLAAQTKLLKDMPKELKAAVVAKIKAARAAT